MFTTFLDAHTPQVPRLGVAGAANALEVSAGSGHDLAKHTVDITVCMRVSHAGRLQCTAHIDGEE